MIAVLIAAGGCGGSDSGGSAGDEASSQEEQKDIALDEVFNAIKDAYGEDYLPDMSYTPEEIEQRYGIPAGSYKEAAAEAMMISANVDEVVLVKTNDDAAKEQVLQALTDYQDQLKNDTMQYPLNQLKIQASLVYEKADYVFFIMLGPISNEEQEQGEDKVIEAYKEQNQRAVEVIDKLFE